MTGNAWLVAALKARLSKWASCLHGSSAGLMGLRWVQLGLSWGTGKQISNVLSNSLRCHTLLQNKFGCATCRMHLPAAGSGA